jgi:hypothetical protein
LPSCCSILSNLLPLLQLPHFLLLSLLQVVPMATGGLARAMNGDINTLTTIRQKIIDEKSTLDLPRMIPMTSRRTSTLVWRRPIMVVHSYSKRDKPSSLGRS